MKNEIAERQNMEPALRQMRARQWTYTVAKRLMIAQIVLTVGVPAVLAISTLIAPTFRPYAAAISLIILLIDTALLDRWYKKLLQKGAKFGEAFDCLVLGLEWNDFVAGEKPEPEDLSSAARKWGTTRTDDGLKDWYPSAAAQMPVDLGRIVCQRANLRYDSQLRRSYGRIICGTAFFVVMVIFFVGLSQRLTLPDWVLALTPAAPLISWTAREYFRQLDAANKLDELIKHAGKLWNKASDGAGDAVSFYQEARELQNAIYLRRATSPLVLPLVYKMKRPSLEDEMKEAATDFLDEYKSK